MLMDTCSKESRRSLNTCEHVLRRQDGQQWSIRRKKVTLISNDCP